MYTCLVEPWPLNFWQCVYPFSSPLFWWRQFSGAIQWNGTRRDFRTYFHALFYHGFTLNKRKIRQREQWMRAWLLKREIKLFSRVNKQHGGATTVWLLPQNSGQAWSLWSCRPLDSVGSRTWPQLLGARETWLPSLRGPCVVLCISWNKIKSYLTVLLLVEETKTTTTWCLLLLLLPIWPNSQGDCFH